MTRPIDEHLLDAATVLVARSPRGAPALSAFEAAVVERIDGRTSNGAVAAALGLAIGDLRIALTPLLASGWLEAPSVRPPLAVQTMAAAATTTGSFAGVGVPGSGLNRLPRLPTPGPGRSPLSTGASVVRDDRNSAASLQALSMRELRQGNFKNARSVAEQALEAAPAVVQHQETLAKWDEHVGREVGAALSKPAERIAALRAWLAVSPDCVPALRRLAELLRDVDVAAAADVAAHALRLMPTDTALRQLHKLLEGEARLAARRQKWRSFFTLTPSASKKS
ncbi:MAG TPA: hypothetical protein VGF99_04700 [Myxococcota bacterium]